MKNSKARLNKEFKEICDDMEKQGDDWTVKAQLVDDDITHWKGVIKGPDGGSYDGGCFVVDINIPSGYPFEPPKMKYDTKVWHPNVSSQTGAICLDILKNEWSPALTIRTALISLQALLAAPEPDDPQDAQVANQLKNTPDLFYKTAKEWTQQHAQNPDQFLNAEPVIPQEVKDLMEMGFDKQKVVEALAANGNNKERALEKLLS